jgi:hypothetical protein
MHKHSLVFAFLFILFASNVFAQKIDLLPKKKTSISKPSRDYLMVQLTYDNWSNKPDTIKTTGLGRGLNIYLCYDWPINNTNFSFATGIGIGSSNIFLKQQTIRLEDTGAIASQATFMNDSLVGYKKYKLATAYLEAPFELRYFSNKENRNTGFKAAIGLRIGTLLNAHTKGVYTVDGNKVADKVDTKRYLEKWRFAATLRVGYGNFSLLGTFNLNSLFKATNGPQVTPYSVGICISGL